MLTSHLRFNHNRLRESSSMYMAKTETWNSPEDKTPKLSYWPTGRLPPPNPLWEHSGHLRSGVWAISFSNSPHKRLPLVLNISLSSPPLAPRNLHCWNLIHHLIKILHLLTDEEGLKDSKGRQYCVGSTLVSLGSPRPFHATKKNFRNQLMHLYFAEEETKGL